MNLNYDSILSDLKKAKSTISTLRQERDSYKDMCEQLESTNKKLSKQLENCAQENFKLKETLKATKQDPLNPSVLEKISEISQELEKIQKKKVFIFFPEQKIRAGLENENFPFVVRVFTEFLLEFARRINESLGKNSVLVNSGKNESEEMSGTGFCESPDELDDLEFGRLINESSSLLETLDKQNSRISTITKNITKVVDTGKFHKSSRSVANLKMPY